MKPIDYVEARHKSVRKANDLIQKSRFKLNLRQQKIMLYLISQIKPTDNEFNTYRFNIAEFCRVAGIEYNGRSYEELKDEIKNIADKSYWITLEDGETETLVRWIEKPKIYKNRGIIELRLDEDLRPYLLNLRNCYTQYQLIYTLSFKHRRSIRLYELVCSIHYNELDEYKRVFELNNLKCILDAENYTEYKYFRRDVLETCVKEITNNSDKNLSYTPIKNGRKVISIEFTISTKKPIERIALHDRLDKELGTDQITFYDELKEKGYV